MNDMSIAILSSQDQRAGMHCVMLIYNGCWWRGMRTYKIMKDEREGGRDGDYTQLVCVS